MRLASESIVARAEQLSRDLARFGRATTLACLGAGLLITGAGAAEPADGPINTGASNGGIANASTGGEVTIGEIVTGENTGNSIATGDISGAADITGGEIAYPTEVEVSLITGPPIADARGGSGGTAESAPDQSSGDADVDVDNNNKSINRNNNSSESNSG